MDQLSGNAGKQLVRSLLSEALEAGWTQLIERWEGGKGERCYGLADEMVWRGSGGRDLVGLVDKGGGGEEAGGSC